ncbi:unnamed protein product [Phytomonas sp. EM1]|nr:unnamed protein product [Phytomonas sp. EM1]|eukprot:CCW61559.1 unnamed protein product [Phytomonas sp. isolate EM1]
MASKRFAFPVLDGVSLTGSTKLAEISQDVLSRLESVLLSKKKAKVSLSRREDGLACLYKIGSQVTLPLTFLGAPCDDSRCEDATNELQQTILVHSPGLAGAFRVQLSDLASCRGQFVTDTHTTSAESQQLGSLCLMEVLQAALRRPGPCKGSNMMERLYLKGRRRHFSAQGTTHLLTRGGQINPGALRLDFPYHTGGAHALKCYMDITDEACRHFGEGAAHGGKVLSRYGAAVGVGVAPDAGLGVACLYWHPYGAQAACLAPVLHGCRLLPVGKVKLELNGPTTSCGVLYKEDLRRYMNTDVEGGWDTSVWLCEGLFGVRPGQAWGDDGLTQVLGVGFNEAAGEFELVLKETESGAVLFADDLEYNH